MSSCINDCKRVHQIEVDSLQDTDKVEHSLLLVKGRIQPYCGSAKQLRATLSLPHKHHEQLTQISAAGEFKLLFDLEGTTTNNISELPTEKEESSCSLQLSCCNAERQLQFTYRPRRSVYRVQPLYLLCHASSDSDQQSEEELKERCELIDVNLRLVQCIYAHKLRAAGYPNRTFCLNGDCRVFQSQLSCESARGKGEDELWQLFASEILASKDWGQQLHLKFVAFIGCTQYDGAAVDATGDYSYANIRRHLHGHAALGGGGLALFGTGHFYAWPRRFADIGHCIRSTERVDVTRLPDESNYRRTYGGVYASTLGAVCHELGHCFDLGHTADGIMGHGFDYLNRVLTVDQPTEHLPQRIVSTVPHSPQISGVTEPVHRPAPSTRPRLTQLKLKTAGNPYLENYHAQRRNDCFYFTHNCAVILAHHRWLHPDLSAKDHSLESACIQLLPDCQSIVSNVPLRIIELRCNLNSLVAHYEEIQEQPTVLHFRLSDSLWQLLATQRTHYAFVLTTGGDTKRLSCDSNN